MKRKEMLSAYQKKKKKETKNPELTKQAVVELELKEALLLGIFHNMKRQADLGPLAWWDQSCQSHLLAIPCDFCIPQPFCMKMNHKGHQNTCFTDKTN